MTAATWKHLPQESRLPPPHPIVPAAVGVLRSLPHRQTVETQIPSNWASSSVPTSMATLRESASIRAQRIREPTSATCGASRVHCSAVLLLPVSLLRFGSRLISVVLFP